MDIDDVGTSLSGKQNHSDYTLPETDLQAHPTIKDKEELLKKYPEYFDGIDEFKDFEYHITLEDTVQPVKHPARKVALSLKKELFSS